MYKRKSYDLGDIREVMEYHNGRYGAPGMPRMKKKKAARMRSLIFSCIPSWKKRVM